MERKILITGVILTICISVIIGVIFIYSGTKAGSNPITIIPQDAAYVMRLNGLGIIEKIGSEKTTVWNDLKSLNMFQDLSGEAKALDSLVKVNSDIDEIVADKDIYLSGHYSGGKNINHLALFSVPSTVTIKTISRFLETDAKTKISNLSTRKYEGKTIFSISLKSSRIFYLSLCNGVIMLSGSPVLIEDAIRQSTLTESLLSDAEFAEMIRTTGKNKDANLFIDFQQVGKLSSILAENSYVNSFRNYKNLGSWSELDINIKSDLLLLNGFTAQEAGMENSFFSSITGDKPVRLEIAKVLPASTSSFLAFGISSPKDGYNAYIEYLKVCDKHARYQANLKNLNTKYGVDFEKFFLELIDNELALVSKEITSTADVANYVLIKCKSGTDAEKQLLELTEKIAGVNEAARTESYSPDRSIHINIHKLPIYPLFGRLLGDLFNVFEECYLTVVDNYIVVAGSYEHASQLAYDFILQKTLENDEVYRDFSENLSMKSYALCYVNLSNTQHFFNKYLSNSFKEDWNTNKSNFSNVQGLGFQVSEVSSMPYINIFLKHFGNYRGKPKTVWQSLLDTTLSSKPSFVVNHYNKQNEIFIQDDKNNVYLINQAGRVLWSFKLTEKINSEIYQVDYFKNGKLQLLFSTENHIHLLDRNGNNVEKYPIRLRSKATAGVSLFDYDKNRNYRLFIPCEDKQVYAYSLDGSILSGWEFKGADHVIQSPIKHFRVTDKDFIVFGDAHKTYILNRKGKERVIVKESISKSINNEYYLSNTGDVSTAYLITTDSKGNLIKIYFDGNVEKSEVAKLSTDHYFDYKDINGDGRSDYIFLDNNTLMVRDHSNAELFTTNFESTITQRPVYYHFSHNNRKIGLVSEMDEKIFLVNNNGELYKNFPLEGKTLFSIGYFDLTSSKFNLIVGGRNNFLYNYAVE